MSLVWEYPKKQLARSVRGRRLLLERLINYGPRHGEKINLRAVRANWEKLRLFKNRKRLMELLLWGKPQS